MKIVDRVIVLNFGKILTEGTPQEIANKKEVMEAYAGRRGG
jgi:branched-chain amino acid transport system ATP-binding protein